MSEQINHCGVADFEELTAFLARAFGKPKPEWFANSLSAVYRPIEELMRCNYVVRQQGRIVGCVGTFPIKWHVGGTTLKMRGIGGVATDPDCRHQGFMKVLMDQVMADMRAEGWPLAWLGGQRQRYRYWGFERCGLRITGHLSEHNVRHEPAWQQVEPLAVEPMASECGVLEQAKALYDLRSDRCERPLDSFWHHMVQWQARPFVGFGADGKIVAYAVLRPNEAWVEELAAADVTAGMGMLRALVQQHKGVGISIDQLSAPLAKVVGDAAEVARTDHCGNWQIFDWCVTLEALLRARHAQSPLLPGRVLLGVQSHQGEADQVVRVEVNETGPHCQRTEQAADLETDSATMMRLVLGPLKPSMVMPLPRSAAILDQWCPLPATISRQDEV